MGKRRHIGRIKLTATVWMQLKPNPPMKTKGPEVIIENNGSSIKVLRILLTKWIKRGLKNLMVIVATARNQDV